MDRSYNPFGSSQAPAAPAGGVSGGVISSGTVGTGGVGAGGVGVPMGPGVISSGTGDVVLAPSGSGKSKKPWIIAGIVAAVITVVCAVAAVVVMNSGPKKTAEEEYADIYDVISEYAFDVYDVNDLIEDGYNGGIDFNELYSECGSGEIGEYQSKMNDFGKKMQKISYDKISDDVKNIAKVLVREQASGYFGTVDNALGKLNSLCGAIVDGNESEVEGFVNSNSLDGTVGNKLISGLKLTGLIEQYQNECAGGAETDVCRGIVEQASGYEGATTDISAVKAVFGALVDGGQVDKMDEFESNMNILINTVSGIMINEDEEDSEGQANEE